MKEYHSQWLRVAVLVAFAACVLTLLLTGSVCAQSSEFRAWWVDAWHAGFKSRAEVDQLISDVQASNCNVIIAQMRRRGDTFYPSSIEPFAADADTSFDSLQYLIDSAHAASPQIQVHAWIVLVPIWSSTTPPTNPNHPYNKYPQYLTKDDAGNTYSTGNGYAFDPGNPDCENYLNSIVLELANNYADLDGICYDYSRFFGPKWGYNSASVARFNARYGRSGTPVYNDADWCQWRRDQITNLIRKNYLTGIAINPNLAFSSALITWYPGPTKAGSFQATRPYYEVFQDWNGWLQEGILDIGSPMNYFDADGAYAACYDDWSNWSKEHQYNRSTVISPSCAMNDIADIIVQARQTRTASNGYTALGVGLYCYAESNSEGLPRSTVLNALVQPTGYDPITPPIFSTDVSVPTLSWKSSPTKGHVKGTITDSGSWIDGVTVSISGSENRSILTDGTGFYGFVDLTPGTYTVSVTYNSETKNKSVTVTAGQVSTVDISFGATSVIVDNLDSNTSKTGTWSTGTGAGGWPTNNSSYNYTTTVTTADHTFTWTPTIPVTGEYDVYLYYLAGVNRSTASPFTIVYSGGSTLVNVDQTINGSQWYKIASNKAFNAGTSGYVRLANNASVTGKVVIADAVKFVLVTPSGPTITTQPATQSVCSGADASFTVAANGSGTLTYQWQKGQVNISNGGHYSGATTATLAITGVDSNDAANYRCVVTDSNGSTNSNEAALTIKTATSISSHPSNLTVDAGQTATFTVAAAGSNLAYQWQKDGVNMSNGGNISGVGTATLTITSCTSTDAATYRCVVSGDCGTVTSNGATLTVNSTPTRLSENFDSYADTSAFTAAWPIDVSPGLSISTSQYYSSPKSVYATTAAMRNRKDFTPYYGTDSTPLNWTFRLYDNNTVNLDRQWCELLDNSPAVTQLIALGKSNTDANMKTYYAARVAYSPGAGWFMLDGTGAPTRSVGWHEFKAVIKGTTIDFYVDGTLAKSNMAYSTTVGEHTFDRARIGSGYASSSAAYYDNLQITGGQ